MPYFKGQHKVVCERCGFTRLSNDCAREPKTGFFVCKDTCLDQWHPQDKPIFGLGEMQNVQDHFPESVRGIPPSVEPGDITAADTVANAPNGVPAAEATPEDSNNIQFMWDDNGNQLIKVTPNDL